MADVLAAPFDQRAPQLVAGNARCGDRGERDPAVDERVSCRPDGSRARRRQAFPDEPLVLEYLVGRLEPRLALDEHLDRLDDAIEREQRAPPHALSVRHDARRQWLAQLPES